MLDSIILDSPSTATACVIWMHGLGADGNDFVPIVRELGLPKNHGVRFVFPNAPKMPVTINGGYVMRAWYDIVGVELDKRADEDGVRRSQEEINEIIAEQRADGIASDRMVLAGFSQGGVIALQTALRHPEKFAGVLALSTYLACADTLGSEGTVANHKTPIFYGHGSADAVIPMALAKQSRAKLENHGHSVRWHEYAMAHSVCAEEIEDIAKFLKKMLAIV